MAKKVILVLIILCILGSSSLWADHISGYTLGGTLMGGGLVFMLVPIVFEMEDDVMGALCFAGGAIALGSGLIWLIVDFATHPSSYADNNSSQRNIATVARYIN